MLSFLKISISKAEEMISKGRRRRRKSNQIKKESQIQDLTNNLSVLNCNHQLGALGFPICGALQPFSLQLVKVHVAKG